MGDRGSDLWNSFLDTALGLLAELDELMAKHHGLSALWFQVLAALYEAPDGHLKLNDLARAIRLSQSGATRLVDRLEKEGFLERINCPSDRRVVYTTLCPKGKAAYERAQPDWKTFLESRFAKPLGEDKLAVLGNLLTRLKPAQTPLEKCPEQLSS